MSSIRLSLLAACMAAAATPAFAQRVVINEFSYDDSSTDNYEFVELYNADSVAVDVSNWVLASQDPSGANAGFTIPAGTVLAPGAFYVLGAGTVPNVTQIVGTSNIWENSNETLELRDAAGTLVDAVAYETYAGPATTSGTWPADIAAEIGDGIWSTFTMIESSFSSWSRIRDGYDTNRNGRDFRQIAWTPGASNNVANVLPVVEFFDTYAHAMDVPGWSSSFVPFRAIDPTNIAPPNPSLVPPSPQGGNAAIMWDPTGGGNYATLNTDAVENVIFEAYVYFNATPEPAGEYESWSIGVQGTCDTFGNHPGFPNSGNPAATANAYGGSGIAVIYQNDEFGGNLYLVDANDMGWGATAATPERILGQIAVTAGVNDGWQRLRIRAGKGFAEARFGGTLGADDGDQMKGSTTMGSPGGVYIGYREFLVQNGSANPPILDFLLISEGTADANYKYDATPNSVGTPTMDPNSFPTIGNASFGLDLASLAPFSPTAMLIGAFELPTPINLELFGAQAGSRIYINSFLSTTVNADANGNAAFGVPIPNNPSFAGATLLFQALNVDLSITGGLSQARVLEVTLGN